MGKFTLKHERRAPTGEFTNICVEFETEDGLEIQRNIQRFLNGCGYKVQKKEPKPTPAQMFWETKTPKQDPIEVLRDAVLKGPPPLPRVK